LAWLGLAWLGLAWLGLAWLGLAWLGLAWLGLAWLGLREPLRYCGHCARNDRFQLLARNAKEFSSREDLRPHTIVNLNPETRTLTHSNLLRKKGVFRRRSRWISVSIGVLTARSTKGREKAS
jgi:hypothetical protein